MPTRIHLSPDASLDEGGAVATKHLLLNEGNLMGHAWPNQEEGVFNLVVRGLSNGLRAPVASFVGLLLKPGTVLGLQLVEPRSG